MPVTNLTLLDTISDQFGLALVCSEMRFEEIYVEQPGINNLQ